jgi:NAD(P)-dependent dehydrogenase (short-subunit alcohol dehydrogenase family)
MNRGSPVRQETSQGDAARGEPAVSDRSWTMSGRVAGKIVLITGGASGIGLASAEACAREGALVVITDVNATEGESQVSRLVADGLGVEFLPQDASSEADWRRVVDEILRRHGQLDVLVNNAGIAVIAPIEQETLEGWRRTQAVNMEGVFLGTREAIRAMKGGGGSIINISSIEGIVGEPMVPAYNASKGGVRILTKSVALYCAQQGYRIRVNSVHPGYVATALVANAIGALPPDQAAALQQDLLSRIPLGRLAEPREIANLVLFLASDESSYMTGSELVVDGGYTAK